MRSPLTKPVVPLFCEVEPCAITFEACENSSAQNKENQEDSLSSSVLSCGDLEHEATLGCVSLQTDSGYSSPFPSFAASTPLAGGSALEASPAHPKLPALQFQLAVQRELSLSYGKTKTFDWSIIHSLAGRFGLHNVIGGKMGLECVDVLQGLVKKDLRHILSKILLLLGDVDLVNCKKVSRTWRKVISGDPRARRRCKEAEQRLRDSRPPGVLLTRDFAPSRGTLCHIQPLASTPIHNPSRRDQKDQDSSRKSRFQEFQEVGSTVKQHEALKVCLRCRSPAQFNRVACRAACTRISCGFIWCTLCHTQYHGSAPCRLAVAPSPSCSSTGLIGSAQSKRNIKRL
ncbi:hypothetical protein GJAV_G00243770 [Gymnothorax javanicus]|nr:hypothetical protein GJAV_G00243770 [Gymnothorax javanicus]